MTSPSTQMRALSLPTGEIDKELAAVSAVMVDILVAAKMPNHEARELVQAAGARLRRAIGSTAVAVYEAMKRQMDASG